MGDSTVIGDLDINFSMKQILNFLFVCTWSVLTTEKKKKR